MIDDIEAIAIGALQASKSSNIRRWLVKSPCCASCGVPRGFQSNVIIGRKSIDADDFVAALENPARHMKADETRGAGNENTHY